MPARATSTVASRCIARRSGPTTAPRAPVPSSSTRISTHGVSGRGADRSLDQVQGSEPSTGGWKPIADRRLSKSSRSEPSRAIAISCAFSPTSRHRAGGRLGDLPAKSITPAAVDKIYEALRGGKDGTKLRRANHTIDIAKKAWTVVQRTHPISSCRRTRSWD